MSRALVTGAGGFIGRHTLLPLLAAGYDVHAVTSRSPADGMPAVVGEGTMRFALWPLRCAGTTSICLLPIPPLR